MASSPTPSLSFIHREFARYLWHSTIPLLVALSLLSMLACDGGSDESEMRQTQQTGEISSSGQASESYVNGSPDKIHWFDYDEGMRKVVGTTKFAIIYFDTSDCIPCMWMQDSLFSNPEVIAAINKNFVPIKVQTARSDTLHYQGHAFTESHLRKIFALPGYPMVLFLEGERNQMVGGQPGIIRPERFLNYMRYHTSRAYKVVTFDDYLENRDTEEPK